MTTAWVLLKFLSCWFTPKAAESGTQEGKETMVHPGGWLPLLMAFRVSAQRNTLLQSLEVSAVNGEQAVSQAGQHRTAGTLPSTPAASYPGTTKLPHKAIILILKSCRSGLSPSLEIPSWISLGASTLYLYLCCVQVVVSP